MKMDFVYDQTDLKKLNMKEDLLKRLSKAKLVVTRLHLDQSHLHQNHHLTF